MSSLIILTSSAPNLGPGLAATHEREGRKERLECQLLERQPGAASRGHVFPASWLLNQGELVFKTSKCVFAKEMWGRQRMETWSQSWAKAQTWTRALGFGGASEIVQPRAAQLRGFFSKSAPSRECLPGDVPQVQAEGLSV